MLDLKTFQATILSSHELMLYGNLFVNNFYSVIFSLDYPKKKAAISKSIKYPVSKALNMAAITNEQAFTNNHLMPPTQQFQTFSKL